MGSLAGCPLTGRRRSTSTSKTWPYLPLRLMCCRPWWACSRGTWPTGRWVGGWLSRLSFLPSSLLHPPTHPLSSPCAFLLHPTHQPTPPHRWIAAGWQVKDARRLLQSLGTLLPAAFLLLATQPQTSSSSSSLTSSFLYVTSGAALSALTLAGVSCSHLDVCPKVYVYRLIGPSHPPTRPPTHPPTHLPIHSTLAWSSLRGTPW